MGWYDFLKDNLGTVLDKIKSAGEENLEFYKGVLVKNDDSYTAVDGKDVSNATIAVYIKGRRNEYQQDGAVKETHALWINLWSRDTEELENIEEIIKNDKKWQKCTEEGIYMSSNLSTTFVRKGEESTMKGIEVKIVNSQESQYTKEDYSVIVEGVIGWIMRLLGEKQGTKIIQRPKIEEKETEVYDAPEDLAIEDIKLRYELFGEGKGIMVGLNSAYIIIEGNDIILEVVDVEIKNQGTLPAYQSYSVKPKQNGILIKRKFDSEPTKIQMLNMIKDAERIVDIMQH